MATLRHYIFVACIALTLIVFTILSNNASQKWLLDQIYSIKSIGSFLTSNTTYLTSNKTYLTSNKTYLTSNKTYLTSNKTYLTSSIHVTSSQTTSKPSAPVCKTGTYYERYSKGYQVTNDSLYVLPNDPATGRLGNQMFVYASLLGIALAQGRRTLCSPVSDLAKTFKLSNVGVIAESVNWTLIREQTFYDERMMNLPMQNLRIADHLLSFWYFTGVEKEVRKEFTFHDSIANAAAMILRDVFVKYNASMIVGVHARRTDFLQKRLKKMGFGVPEKSYFMKAFSLMKSKFPGRNITFLVASDDLPWCHENLSGKDVAFMPPATAAVHMAVLSRCDHIIISSGTYGYWSAWLSGGHVIYYPGYMRKGSYLGKWFRDDLYYPRTWTPMEN